MKSKMILMLFLIGCIQLDSIFADDDDPVGRAKLYPPALMNYEGGGEIASIEWQIEQLEPMIARYTMSRDEISFRISKMENQIEEMNMTVPVSLRNLDKTVRSQLAGKALEKLLDARLELAAIEQSVAMLQEQNRNDDGNDNVKNLRRQESQLETAMAQKRFELADAEYQRVRKLHQTGTISQQQLQRAQNSAEIAQLEFTNARTRETIEMERAQVEAAEQIAQGRLSAGPVKARIKTIEEFLQQIADSSNVIRETEQLNRQMELWQLDLKMVAGELFELERRKIELSSLQKLIDQKMNRKDSK